MPSPPRLATRLLAWVLRRDSAGTTILGDLFEDFARILRTRGPARARLWYWKEAVLLACGRLATVTARRWRSALRLVERPEIRAIALDGRYALRTLRRGLAFTLFAAGLIGLGVGATTAVFSVFKPLALAPLPVSDPDALVWIANDTRPGESSLSAVTSRTANLRDFRDRSRTLSGLAGYNVFLDHSVYTMTGRGEPERLQGVAVTRDFLDVLGVEPLVGRNFVAEEGVWGGPPAIVLSHGFWLKRFAGSDDVLGAAIDLNGRPHSVVGVLPRSFDFSSLFNPGVRIDFLLPFPLEVPEEASFEGNLLAMIGRLADGETPESAQAELDVLVAALQEDDPDRWGLGARVTPLAEHIAGPFRPALLLLAAAAATLLLIVCVNVVNLMLARAPARAPEVAVRKAFGASRGRLARQLVFEVMAIALGGAVIGSALAWAATRLVRSTAGVRIPLLDQIQVDAAALCFAVATAVVTGFLVALVTALQVREGRESSVLRAATTSSSSPRALRLREVLVVAEVTLACVLLVTGGLIVRSFRAVLDVDLGFEPADALVWQLEPTTARAERISLYSAITDRVAAITGVEEVGLVDELPLGRNRSWSLSVVGGPELDDGAGAVFPHLVDAGYLPAMRIPVVAGRNLSNDDRQDAAKVVLINQSGAQRIFEGANPLGRRIKVFGPWEWEVVGIVRDVRHVAPEQEAGIEVYFPLTQMPDYEKLDLVVRSGLPARQIVPAVSAAIREIAPSMPTGDFWTLASTVDRAVSARRFTLGILLVYGLSALVLAGLGIYGVVAQLVSVRRAEFGIRMALGASAPSIVWSVMTRTLLLAGLGIAAGAALALANARVLESLLFHVSAQDPTTFIGAAVVLFLVAALGGAVPAVRAGRTRVARVLRAD